MPEEKDETKEEPKEELKEETKDELVEEPKVKPIVKETEELSKADFTKPEPEEKIVCPSCGTTLKVNQQKCDSCGNEIDWVEE